MYPTWHTSYIHDTSEIHMGYIGIHSYTSRAGKRGALLPRPRSQGGKPASGIRVAMTKQMMWGSSRGLWRRPICTQGQGGNGWPESAPDRCAAHDDDIDTHSPWHPRDTYPACIPHVSAIPMNLWCIPYVSWLPLRIHVSCHVSRMYPACLLYNDILYRNWPFLVSKKTPIPWCIQHVSWLPLRIHLSHMYPACILHFRYMPLWMHLRHMYPIMYPEIMYIPDVYMYYVS